MVVFAVVTFFCVIIFVTLGLIVGLALFKETPQDSDDFIKVDNSDNFNAKLVEKDDDEDISIINESCLSKIDKSVSLCDFSMDLDGNDTVEDFELLRKKQEKRYKREKQEG